MRTTRGKATVFLCLAALVCGCGSSQDVGRTTQVRLGPCRETTLARFPPAAEIQQLLPNPMTPLTADAFFSSINATPFAPPGMPLEAAGVAILATFDCDDAAGRHNRLMAVILAVEPLTHPEIPDDEATTHFYIYKPGYSGAFLKAGNNVGIASLNLAGSSSTWERAEISGEPAVGSSVSMIGDGQPYFDAVADQSSEGFRNVRVNFHLWGESGGGLLANQAVGNPQFFGGNFSSCAIAANTDAETVFGACDPSDTAAQMEYESFLVHFRYFPGLSIEQLVPK